MTDTEKKLKLKIAELENRIEQLETTLSYVAIEKPYYSVEEYAHLLDLNPMTVYKYVHSGEIKAVKIGKSWRIPKES